LGRLRGVLLWYGCQSSEPGPPALHLDPAPVDVETMRRWAAGMGADHDRPVRPRNEADRKYVRHVERTGKLVGYELSGLQRACRGVRARKEPAARNWAAGRRRPGWRAPERE